MKITLEIKKNKYDAFIEIIKSLEYVTLTSENEIPDWQQQEVEKRTERLNKYPDSAIDIDNTLSDIKKKYGL